MSDETTYAVYDHDTHGDPHADQGVLALDEETGKVLCSIHGNTVAIDGTATRPAFQPVQDGIDAEGRVIWNYDKGKETGQAQLYRCTVCGQGAWIVAP